MTLSRRRFISITAASVLGAYPLPWGRTIWAPAGQGVALGAHADLRLVGLPAREAQRLLA